MTWDHHIFFAIAAALLWGAGAVLSFRRTQKSFFWTIVLYTAGILVYGSFAAGLWILQKRPPMVTMGEIRLWYTLFLTLAGLLTFLRWRSPLILPLATVMALVFSLINIVRPQIHSQVLAPALQSVFFIPHVTVYMFSYALLACAFLLTVVTLVRPKTKGMPAIDALSRIGFSFFTIGMLLGSIWARQAWGEYWAWDPKETWAAITWLFYVLYFHIRKSKPQARKRAGIIFIIAFVALQICWYGYRYLPGAETGLHNYSL